MVKIFVLVMRNILLLLNSLNRHTSRKSHCKSFLKVELQLKNKFLINELLIAKRRLLHRKDCTMIGSVRGVGLRTIQNELNVTNVMRANPQIPKLLGQKRSVQRLIQDRGIIIPITIRGTINNVTLIGMPLSGFVQSAKIVIGQEELPVIDATLSARQMLANLEAVAHTVGHPLHIVIDNLECRMIAQIEMVEETGLTTMMIGETITIMIEETTIVGHHHETDRSTCHLSRDTLHSRCRWTSRGASCQDHRHPTQTHGWTQCLFRRDRRCLRRWSTNRVSPCLPTSSRECTAIRTTLPKCR
ncbi:hypothetical protein BLNAU_7898 [Blattamonas nauphoetae]|uniref:Uncharacterized protein n=1 Tax=Blattamonas nauphoetae TaxID=2049346 RepID=A0ABQ9Y026_9EUKA|nr:hypothetical protein BLNAU_7898 [Blattamonas nauphoetae]